MQEEWRDVVGWEGLYQVSNEGNVRSLFDGYYPRIRSLNKKLDRYGYLSVCLTKKGKSWYKTVHRLVAEAFIPNPNNYPCVNHKNEDKTDNNVDNLEFCTVSYNNHYGTHYQRVSETQSRPVNQLTLDGKVVKTWKSGTEAGRNGFSQECISRCCAGINRTHRGFIWRYVNE